MRILGRRAAAVSAAITLSLALLVADQPGGGPGPIVPRDTAPAARPVARDDRPAPIRVGAVFPISGNAAGLAGQELAGVRMAADLVNADGGVGGRPVELVVRDLEAAREAPAVMAAMRADGIHVVIGAYSSDLSIAASAAADSAGLVYWEAGAVADRLTGRGLPLVFRVGASGTDLGSNSARFAATELAPLLHVAPAALDVAIVNADDAYARSVADAADRTARTAGMPIVSRVSYDPARPDWPAVMKALGAGRPAIIILAAHIPDGIAFRRAMLAAGLRVKALIGSTMAQCDPDFAGELGADAIGVFASDRPTGGFQPGCPGCRRAGDVRPVRDGVGAAAGPGCRSNRPIRQAGGVAEPGRIPPCGARPRRLERADRGVAVRFLGGMATVP